MLSAFHAAQPIARLGWVRGDSAEKAAFRWATDAGVEVERMRFLFDERCLAEWQPDVVLAFPGGKGTAATVKIAKDAGVEVLLIQET